MISDNLLLNDDKTEFLIIGTKQQLAKVNINCIIIALGLGRLMFVL